MNIRTVKPMVVKLLNEVLSDLEPIDNPCANRAKGKVLQAIEVLGSVPGEIMFTWKGPNGTRPKTSGRTAHEAAQKLGEVLGWPDNDTVTIYRNGSTYDYKLLGGQA